MRMLQTAVCVDCDLRTVLSRLGIRTLHVCRTLPELYWALSSMPDVVIATGPVELVDRIHRRELMTHPAVILTEADPEGRLNCLRAEPNDESLRAALDMLSPSRQCVPDGAKRRALELLTQLGVQDGPGRDMLLCAVLHAYLDRKLISDMMAGLYSVVAEHFSTTAVYVKQRIYRAIERAWTRGNAQMQYELFLNTIDDKRAKPTNTDMIALIADILRLEGFEWQISKE